MTPPIDFTRSHYRRIGGERDEAHPIERAVAAVPEVREVDARARAQAKRMRRPSARADAAEWVRHEDLRLLQRTVRQERFFDAGFEHGLVAGRTESLRATATAATGPGADAVAELADLVRETLLDSPVPCALTIAVLLELAHALTLDQHAPPAPP
jgi:hypothetical protein